MALIQKAFSDIITFSRSSNATRVGPTGLVEYAPHNLLLYSQEFDNAAWTKGANVTVTANAAAAPDGTVTADLVVSSASADSSTNQVFQQVTVASSQTYTTSFWVRTAGANQNITVRQTANGVLVTNTTVAVTSTWQRVSVTFTASTNPGFAIRPDTVSNLNIYIWGAQLAVGPYALDYTPTTSAAVYGPRFDFDPVTLAARGLLVEEQRTNLLTYSEQFDNAAWVKSGTTVTANAAAAPNGTVTADLVTANTSSSFGFLYSNNIASGVFTTSVYAKQGTQRYIQFLSTATTAYWANFDLQDGLAYAGGTTSSVSIVSVGNGWYRCSLSVTDSNSNQPTIGFVTSLNSARAPSTTLTTNCYLWGAQLEAGSFATSYIPTIASTVTRSADVASVNTLSPWFNATEGTLFAEYNNPYPVAADQYVAVLQDASYVANAISIRNYTTAIINQVWAGSVRQVDIVDGTASANATSKTTFAYQLNNSAASSNGGTAVVDTTCTMPTGILTLNIGNRNGNSEFKNGYIRRIAYYPRRLTNAELQALTS